VTLRAIVANTRNHGDREGKEQELEKAVEQAHRRREHWLQTGEWPMGRALAMMGRFGWAIVAPILLGAFVGRWLDRTFGSGVFWSAALVFLGAAAGFWSVWKRMNSE
jgi:ATP synthase protein I